MSLIFQQQIQPKFGRPKESKESTLQQQLFQERDNQSNNPSSNYQIPNQSNINNKNSICSLDYINNNNNSLNNIDLNNSNNNGSDKVLLNLQQSKNSPYLQPSPVTKEIEFSRIVSKIGLMSQSFIGKGELSSMDMQNIQDIQQQMEGRLPRIWRKQFFGILGIFARFLRRARTNTLMQFRPESYLSKQQFGIINDTAYELNHYDERKTYFEESLSRDKLVLIRQEKQFGMLYKQLRKTYRKLDHWVHRKGQKLLNFILLPLDRLHIRQDVLKLWDICVTSIVLSEVIILSLQLTFSDFMRTSYFYIQVPLLIAFLIDLLLSFFKGFQDKGVFQTSTRVCFLHYLQTGFLYDSVSLIFGVLGDSLGIPQLSVVFLLRLTSRCYTQQQQLVDTLKLNERFGNEKVKLLELVFTIFLLAHLSACIWYLIGDLSMERYGNRSGINSWLQSYQLEDKEWQEKYVASLFWVFTTMTTIGFGDIVPQNLQERLVAIALMMLSCFIFAYSVNSIGSLLNAINEKQAFHRERLKSINAYMDARKISQGLQQKIRCYLDYVNQEEQDQKNQNEDQSVQQLSKSLKEQLLLEVNYSVLLKMKIFKSTSLPLSDQFLKELSLQLQERTFMPEDIVSNSGEENQIYFVVKGEIKLVAQPASKRRSQTVLRVINAGQSFGEFGFISQEFSRSWSVASTVCTVNSLRYSDFLRIIHNYPQDYEKYCMLREELMFNSNFDQLNITCSFCFSGNHQEIECKLISYQPSKQNLILKASRSQPIGIRTSSFSRKDFQKPNSLTINTAVQDSAFDFQEDIGLLNKSIEDQLQGDEKRSQTETTKIKQQKTNLNNENIHNSNLAQLNGTKVNLDQFNNRKSRLSVLIPRGSKINTSHRQSFFKQNSQSIGPPIAANPSVIPLYLCKSFIAEEDETETCTAGNTYNKKTFSKYEEDEGSQRSGSNKNKIQNNSSKNRQERVDNNSNLARSQKLSLTSEDNFSRRLNEQKWNTNSVILQPGIEFQHSLKNSSAIHMEHQPIQSILNFDEIEGKNKKNEIIQGISNNNLFNTHFHPDSVVNSTEQATILVGGISHNQEISSSNREHLIGSLQGKGNQTNLSPSNHNGHNPKEFPESNENSDDGNSSHTSNSSRKQNEVNHTISEDLEDECNTEENNQDEQEDPLSESIRAELEFLWTVKGDQIETDRMECFEIYRTKDNYMYHLEAYNEAQDLQRERLIKKKEIRTKKRVHKTNIFSPVKFKNLMVTKSFSQDTYQ